MRAGDVITIGELARRTGLSVSAVRYYEARGLVASHRSAGGQRRFMRADIRRVSFIRIAQQFGLSIDAIGRELARLPLGRTPTQADWARIGAGLRGLLDARIAELTRTRNLLDGCIGCGCLSLKRCALYNPGDKAARGGAGPRYVLGDPIGAPEG
jgi:MerR family redox-sensitive transcriptional activator SoxR